MIVRKYTSGLAAFAVAAGLTLAGIAPASAEPSFTPDANDIVGVGSDTIEFVMADLAAGKTIDGAHVNGWNDSHNGPEDQRLASFDATGASPVVLRDGSAAVTRPNGSGQGKGALYGDGNNADVNFARSSSAINGTEASNGLWAYPFAVDGLKMAVSGQVASHAPAGLTGPQVLGIYDGTFTNWSQVGGTAGAIKPFIPQSGSGTRSFFESQLTALKGSAWSVSDYAGSVQETQEHDPTDIQGNADAVVPFSTARAQTLSSPGAVKLEEGWSAQRAVYNVVRAADKDAVDGWASQIFGGAGFLCTSPDAKAIIEANGFAQLATEAHGGVCGVPTQSATTNFTSNTVETTTTLAAASPAGRKVTLTATIAADGQVADGDVEFYEGEAMVGTGLLTGGQSVLNLTGVTPGTHTYTAKFASANPAAFTDSTSDEAEVLVKETSTTKVAVKAATYGHSSTVTATVTSNASATGQVQVKVGTFTASKALSGGKAVFTLPKTLSVGKKTATATFAGNASTAGSKGSKAFTVAKSSVKVAESFGKTVAKGKKARGTVTVSLLPSSTVKATGSVTVKLGKKVLGKGTLKKGKVTLTLAKMSKGKHTLTASYGGSKGTKAKSIKFSITQK